MQKVKCGFTGLSFLLARPFVGTDMAGVEISMTTVYMNTNPTVINAWEPWFKEVRHAPI